MDTELLQKYISGNATEAEKRHITEWMQEKPENMREYMAQRKLYDIALWRTLPAVVEKKKAGKRFSVHTLWVEMAKAAVVVAIVLLGTHYWDNKHQTVESSRTTDGNNVGRWYEGVVEFSEYIDFPGKV